MAQERTRQVDQAKQWGQIVAQAWADPAFKGRLLADPRAVVQELGMAVPAGKAVRIAEQADDTVQATENTDDSVLLILPPKPGVELADEQLAQVAGGCCHCYQLGHPHGCEYIVDPL